MNMNEFSQELYGTMHAKLNEVELAGKDSIVKESSCIEIVKSHTYGLKNFLCQYEFASRQEEIQFFKAIKPKFVSLLLRIPEQTLPSFRRKVYHLIRGKLYHYSGRNLTTYSARKFTSCRLFSDSCCKYFEKVCADIPA